MSEAAEKRTKALEEFYPYFPWVEIGQHYGSNKDNRKIEPPKPMDEADIKLLIDKGRREVQKLIESNIDEMYRMLTQERGWSADESGNKHQKGINKGHKPSAQWSHSDQSAGLDNRGEVRLDISNSKSVSPEITRIETDFVSEKNEVVGRHFDHILSVLESLHVGEPDEDAWKEAHNVKWQRPRTVSPIMYPNGPNMLVRMIQDHQYQIVAPGIKNRNAKATNAVHENFYNIFDGIIIANKSQDPIGQQYPKSKEYAAPPRWREWCDTTWYMWNKLHRSQSRGKDPNALGAKFPPKGLSAEERELFHCGVVSGRAASKVRANLTFYESLTPTSDLMKMNSFLNYVVFYGDTVTSEDVAVILKCLQSRGPASVGGVDGKVPVWGNQETFQVGHWAYYALLATQTGQQLAWLLAKHKSAEDLGIKLLRSVTIFAADSMLTGQELPLKWPVLVWQLSGYDEGLIVQARQLELDYTDEDTGMHKATPQYRWKLPNIECPRLCADSSTMFPRVMLPSPYTWVGNEWPGNILFKEYYSKPPLVASM